MPRYPSEAIPILPGRCLSRSKPRLSRQEEQHRRKKGMWKEDEIFWFLGNCTNATGQNLKSFLNQIPAESPEPERCPLTSVLQCFDPFSLATYCQTQHCQLWLKQGYSQRPGTSSEYLATDYSSTSVLELVTGLALCQEPMSRTEVLRLLLLTANAYLHPPKAPSGCCCEQLLSCPPMAGQVPASCVQPEASDTFHSCQAAQTSKENPVTSA